MKKTLFVSIALVSGLLLVSGSSNAQAPVKKAVQTQQVEMVYFTCPMHPQVKKDKAGKCPLCGMALVEKKMQVKKPGRMQHLQDSAMMKKHDLVKKGGQMQMKRDSVMKKGQMMKKEGIQKMKKDTARMKRRIGM
jgi:hypothetical protein